MAVPAGQCAALVGESGSGKSTIVGLLLRFYDPIQGKVSGQLQGWPGVHATGAAACSCAAEAAPHRWAWRLTLGVFRRRRRVRSKLCRVWAPLPPTPIPPCRCVWTTWTSGT